MSPEEFEFGYRYVDTPNATVGPFRNKRTAVQRVGEDLDRVLMQRPAGSTDPREWEEVPAMKNPAPVPVCPGCQRVDCICGSVTKR